MTQVQRLIEAYNLIERLRRQIRIVEQSQSNIDVIEMALGSAIKACIREELDANQPDLETETPAPSIEVDMRVAPTAHGYKWEWRFGTEPWFVVVARQRIYSATPALTQAHGNAWLAALSKRFGVPLKANWEDNAES